MQFKTLTRNILAGLAVLGAVAGTMASPAQATWYVATMDCLPIEDAILKWMARGGGDPSSLDLSVIGPLPHSPDELMVFLNQTRTGPRAVDVTALIPGGDGGVVRAVKLGDSPDKGIHLFAVSLPGCHAAAAWVAEAMKTAR